MLKSFQVWCRWRLMMIGKWPFWNHGTSYLVFSTFSVFVQCLLWALMVFTRTVTQPPAIYTTLPNTGDDDQQMNRYSELVFWRHHTHAKDSKVQQWSNFPDNLDIFHRHLGYFPDSLEISNCNQVFCENIKNPIFN